MGGAHLVSEHSLAEQDEIMVNGFCPQAENVAECEEQLPNFWESIAVVLWPAYYSPEADWVCAGICKAPEDHAMTCASHEDERCPRVVDPVIRQGLPLLAA